MTVIVTLNLNGGSLADGSGDESSSIEVEVGSPYGALPTPVLSGHAFKGWLLGYSLVTADTVCVTPEDHSLTAIWQSASSSASSVGDALYTFDPALGTFSSGYVSGNETIEDTDTILTAISDVFRDSLGLDALDPSTPLGRVLEWLALNFATSMRVNVQNANQLVIGSAAGQQLDAIALWFGLYRKPASATSVVCDLTGSPGSVIPAGSRARTSTGAVFELQSNAVLDSSGNGTGVFLCTETGPVACPAGTLTAIDSARLDWYTVSNPDDGVAGEDIETDEALRARIEESRFHSIGFLGAMKNAIELVPGVRSCMVVENNTGGSLTVCGIDHMTAHTIFVCVQCEDDSAVFQEVAKAIFETKPCGTGYHVIDGSEEVQEVNVTDPFGNSYPVTFHTPEDHPVNIDLKVRNRSFTGASVVSSVQSAVLDWASAHAFRVGETVYASDVIRAVEDALPGIIVLSCAVTDGGEEQAGSSLSAQASLSFLDIPAKSIADFSSAGITVTVM